MILSYNWQLIEPVSDETALQSLLKVSQPASQQQSSPPVEPSPNVTLHPLFIRQPTFALIFSYYIEKPSTDPPQITILPELSHVDRQIQIRLTKHRQTSNHIYLAFLIENCECYETILTLLFKVCYHWERTTNRGLDTLEQLLELVGSHEYDVNKLSTYATVRTEITIEEPLRLHYRYGEGYLWVKLSRMQNQPVEVLELELMNWLAVGNQALKMQVVRSSLESSPSGKFTLCERQSFAVMFFLKSNLIGCQIPLLLRYRLHSKKQSFKMIKIMKIQQA